MGRAALVTGAASGIGRAIAERLRADGLDVVGVDLDGADAGISATAAFTGAPLTMDLGWTAR